MQRPTIDIGSLVDSLQPQLHVELRVPVRRPDDLAVFDLVFQNLKLASGQPPKLVRENPKKSAYLIVELPPQSFGEEAYLDATGPEFPPQPIIPPFQETRSGLPLKNTASAGEPLRPLPSAKVRMLGRNRLAFTMPADVQEVPFNLDAVMAAARNWPLRLDAIAAPELSGLVHAACLAATQELSMSSVRGSWRRWTGGRSSRAA
jgi:hypothetical protein